MGTGLGKVAHHCSYVWTSRSLSRNQ